MIDVVVSIFTFGLVLCVLAVLAPNPADSVRGDSRMMVAIIAGAFAAGIVYLMVSGSST